MNIGSDNVFNIHLFEKPPSLPGDFSELDAMVVENIFSYVTPRASVSSVCKAFKVFEEQKQAQVVLGVANLEGLSTLLSHCGCQDSKDFSKIWICVKRMLNVYPDRIRKLLPGSVDAIAYDVETLEKFLRFSVDYALVRIFSLGVESQTLESYSVSADQWRATLTKTGSSVKNLPQMNRNELPVVPMWELMNLCPRAGFCFYG